MSLLLAAHAHAFSIETAFTTGCHERITVEALRRAGWPNHQAEPAPTSDELRLINNLPFQVPAGSGPWTVALIIGVRSNDLHGVAPTDFPEFAAAQLAEDAQEEHCLRTAAEDFVRGDVDALGHCDSFVQGRAALALGPLEHVDLFATERVRLALRYQDTELELSRFAYRVGQAMHAIQDSYTHTLRAPGAGPVLHVFNFVDPALRHDYAAHRDGFGHVSKLDGCEPDDPLERERVERAIAASAALLAALGAEDVPRETRLLSVADVLAPVVKYEPGCTPENDWCDAALTEGTQPSSCSTSPGLAVALSLLGLVRRRRALALLAVLFALPARAADVSGYLGVGASIDRAALNVDLGVRLAVHPRVTLGLDVEFNPWFNVLSASVAPGVINAYASGSWRWLDTGTVTLRSTLKAGTSVLLFDVVGAQAGSVGVFVGASLLGVSLQLKPGLQLVLDPLEVDLAVPSLKGVPFAMRQYRLSIGLEQRF